MEKAKWIAIAVLVATLVASLKMVGDLKKEVKRQKNNVKTLSEDIFFYQLRDSVQCAEIGTLRLTKKELLQLRAADAEVIKELGVKTKDVETIVKTETVVRDTVVFVYKDSCISYSDKWTVIEACLNSGQMNYQFTDSVLTSVYVKYNRRFLWWRWKPEYRTVVVNFNPKAKVNFAESIIME